MEARPSDMTPIFRPLRARFEFLGVPFDKALIILLVVFAGLMVSIFLGGWKHSVEVPYDNIELAQKVNEYKIVVESARSASAQIEADGGYQSLTDTQKEALKKCTELGLSTTMSDEQVAATTPKTHVSDEEVVPFWVRLVVFCVIPAFVGILLFVNIKRTSVYKELKRSMAFSKRQKAYACRPIEYMKRATGKGYYTSIMEAFHID